jgi:hypothetical protein
MDCLAEAAEIQRAGEAIDSIAGIPTCLSSLTAVVLICRNLDAVDKKTAKSAKGRQEKMRVQSKKNRLQFVETDKSQSKYDFRKMLTLRFFAAFAVISQPLVPRKRRADIVIRE